MVSFYKSLVSYEDMQQSDKNEQEYILDNTRNLEERFSCVKRAEFSFQQKVHTQKHFWMKDLEMIQAIVRTK